MVDGSDQTQDEASAHAREGRDTSLHVQYPFLRTAQSASHIPLWQTFSLERHLDLSGKRSATLQ